MTSSRDDSRDKTRDDATHESAGKRLSEASSSSSSSSSSATSPAISTRAQPTDPYSAHHRDLHNGQEDINRDRDWDSGSEPETDAVPEEQDPEKMANWTGQASIKGSSEAVRLSLLSLVHLGLTFTWGVETTYCTPYLLSLGLTKGQTSLVWIAGPLSGLMVQPIVGVISDQSRSKWGRRRPYILVCSIMVAGGLLMLGFTKEIITTFISDTSAAEIPTIVLAVVSLYFTDFAINAVMSCSRSLMVDVLPISKQQSGAAWSSRLGAVGHILGYGLGTVDLIGVFGTALGKTQFQQLTVIAAMGIFTTSCITCWAVSERVLLSPPMSSQGNAWLGIFRQIWSTLQTLPPRMQGICWAVFWSWIGWYPFLIYSSTWVGETYFRYDAPAGAAQSKDALGEMGRVGSTALAVYSLITFTGAWILPLLVKGPDESGFTSRPPQSIAPLLKQLSRLHKPDLLTIWVTAHLMFAGSMALAPLAASFRFATALVAFCGIPWTIAMWAPTTFLGVEVNKLTGGDEGRDGTSYRMLSNDAAAATDDDDNNNNNNNNPIELADVSHLENGRSSSRMISPSTSAAAGRGRRGSEQQQPTLKSTGELSGVYFGILNIYTTVPQFIGTFISTIVFAFLDPGKSPELSSSEGSSSSSSSSSSATQQETSRDGPNAIAVCLFIGAMSALGAAYATRRLKYIS